MNSKVADDPDICCWRTKVWFQRTADNEYQLDTIELRAIKKGHFANNETGVLNEIEFVGNLFNEAA